MKIIFKKLLLISFIILSCLNSLNSQPNIGGIPLSDTLKSIKREVKSILMPMLNIDSLIFIDSLEQIEGKPFRFGYAFEVDYNLKDIGTCDTLSDGSVLWRLIITSSNAYSIH